jgi:NADH:ubiquinone oxidoreductase subunit E
MRLDPCPEEIRELPAKYPQPRSAVMPALDLAQEGWAT